MRVVFMGTPAFAATILDDLAEHHDVAAVYTRPDAVRGRGKRLEPSPVKAPSCASVEILHMADGKNKPTKCSLHSTNPLKTSILGG